MLITPQATIGSVVVVVLKSQIQNNPVYVGKLVEETNTSYFLKTPYQLLADDGGADGRVRIHFGPTGQAFAKDPSNFILPISKTDTFYIVQANKNLEENHLKLSASESGLIL